jgi:hypothetical protein
MCAERSEAVGAYAAELAVEISLAGIERGYGLGDRRIFMRPDPMGWIAARSGRVELLTYPLWR